MIVYFPSHIHQIEGTTDCYISSERHRQMLDYYLNVSSTHNTMISVFIVDGKILPSPVPADIARASQQCAGMPLIIDISAHRSDCFIRDKYANINDSAEMNGFPQESAGSCLKLLMGLLRRQKTSSGDLRDVFTSRASYGRTQLARRCR